MELFKDSKIEQIMELNIDKVPKGKITRYWLEIVKNGLGESIYVPVIVAKGNEKGKVVGITAVVHGNELNGIPVIQKLFKEIDINKLKGTIVGVPVVNVPSFLIKKRRFVDGVDLNHIMPGKPDGSVSQVYAHRIITKLVNNFDFLLDLHTASNGRTNSYYVRADMDDPIVKKMALLQNAEIIVHNPPNDGTLRGTASNMKIPAITLEVGNPNLFQKGRIREGLTGMHNILSYFKLNNDEVEESENQTILCEKSYWIYTDTGGLLTVLPNLTELVIEGQEIAIIRNVFGDILKKYYAPENGIVIGKSVNPVNQAGGRILHIGIKKKNEI